MARNPLAEFRRYRNPTLIAKLLDTRVIPRVFLRKHWYLLPRRLPLLCRVFRDLGPKVDYDIQESMGVSKLSSITFRSPSAQAPVCEVVICWVLGECRR